MGRRLTDKKLYAERIHAKRRALERAGVDYNRFDLKHMAEQIQKGYSTEIQRQSIARRVHILAFRRWNGDETRVHIVVYNKNTNQIITFLDGLM